MRNLRDWWSARRRWQKVAISVVALLIVAAPFAGEPDEADPVAGSDSDATTAAPPTTSATTQSTALPPETTAATTSTTTSSTTTTTTTTTTSAAPTTTQPPGSFGDGVWLVGDEIDPGLYVTGEADFCYWARLSDLSGDFDAILANANITGQGIVELLDSDVAFESDDCGLWVPYIPGDAGATSFGDGVWAVGDIAPGVYESEGTGCYWARLGGFTGDFDDLLANSNVDGRIVVEIVSSDAGFETTGCGVWAPLDDSKTPDVAGFGDGVHVVGVHIAPGRYVAEEVASCYWARLSGVSGDFGDVIANDIVDGRAIVEVSTNDYAFESSGCGIWQAP